MKKIFAMLIIFCVIIFSTKVQAEIKTFEGTGSYPITDEKTHGEVKELAKKEAIRDALEKAGIAIFSQTQVENNMVTKDVIKVTAGSILKVLSDNYKFMPLDEDDGIGMYRSTVKVSIDTDELDKKLNDFLRKESEEQSSLAKQYEDLQKLNYANTKKILELKKQLSEKNSSQNKQQILNEVAEIDKNSLYAQKITEGWNAWENKNFETSLKLFDDAVKLNLKDYQGFYGRGTSNLDLKNYSQAISDLNKSIELNPNHKSSYNNRGIAHRKLENYQQAINDHNQAIKLDSNSYSTYNNLGNLYRILNNYDKAMENFNKCLQINPKCAIAYYNRGLLYEDLQNYTKAEEDFAKARELGFAG